MKQIHDVMQHMTRQYNIYEIINSLSQGCTKMRIWANNRPLLTLYIFLYPLNTVKNDHRGPCFSASVQQPTILCCISHMETSAVKIGPVLPLRPMLIDQASLGTSI
ncbi:hypothetical protein XENOCAPTIV_007538 [Xenoophorus captivus]|uniref:Uncharacterized protein n=1 Tax=Xenoophorus captivus TaxID=1517983 RepID=A0ABV0R7J9_9TELE